MKVFLDSYSPSLLATFAQCQRESLGLLSRNVGRLLQDPYGMAAILGTANAPDQNPSQGWVLGTAEEDTDVISVVVTPEKGLWLGQLTLRSGQLPWRELNPCREPLSVDELLARAYDDEATPVIHEEKLGNYALATVLWQPEMLIGYLNRLMPPPKSMYFDAPHVV